MPLQRGTGRCSIRHSLLSHQHLKATPLQLPHGPQHQRPVARPQWKQQTALPGTTYHTSSARLPVRVSKLAALRPLHDGHHLSPVWGSRSTPGQGASPYVSTPAKGTTVAASSSRPDGGTTTDSHLQHQQYVKHVQNVPVGWQRQSNSGGHPSNTEAVLSYQQLFQQESTDSASRHSSNSTGNASSSSHNQQRQQQQGKGFGSNHRSKSGPGDRSSRAAQLGKDGASAAAGAGAGAARVQFYLTHQVEYGQSIKLLGSGPQLGNWNQDKCLGLSWHEGHKWSTDVDIPAGGHEFKFLVAHRSGHLEWEPGSNRSITVPPSAAEMQVAGQWGATEDTEVLELEQQPAYRQQLKQLQQEQEQEAEEVEEQEAQAAVDSSSSVKEEPAISQQQQPQQRPAAQAAPSAAAAAAAAAAYEQQAAQVDAAAAAHSQEIEAAARAAALLAAAEEPAAAAAAETGGIISRLDVSLLDVPDHKSLMQVLLGFRQDMMEGLAGVTDTMQEIQDELSQVQQQVARLSAERFLDQQQQQLQQKPSTLGPAAALEAAAALFRPPASGQGAATPAADVTVIPPAAGGVARPDDGLVSELHTAVQSWKEELLDFKQDSLDLRKDLEDLKVSLEEQMAENTAAVRDLEQLVKQLIDPTTVVSPPTFSPLTPERPDAQSYHGGGSFGTTTRSSTTAGRTSSSNSDGGGSGSWGAGPQQAVSAAAGQFTQDLDLEDQMLLAKINHLASDLSAEMKEAVYALEVQQQTLLERQHHIIADAAHISISSFEEDVGSAVEGWLDSDSTQLYHQGLLVAVMMACGLWADGLWEQLQGQALRSTWSAYASVWSEEYLQHSCQHSVTNRQQLLSALASGRQQLLALHVLWSLQELSTHNTTVQQLLTRVATPIELGLMMKLRQRGGPGKGWALGVSGAPVAGGEAAAAAQCAVVLQRWLAATQAKLQK